MKPADVHALLLPLQPGDLTPAELDIHGQRQWTVDYWIGHWRTQDWRQNGESGHTL